MPATRQMCTFTVDGNLFGVELERVQEILRAQPLARIPLAPSEVAGLINLRGQIVPAIDLRRRLAMAERSPEAEPTNVVLRGDDGAVSLLVDEIGDILTVSAETFEPPPEHLRGPLRALLLGVHKLQDALLLVLSPDAAIDISPLPQA
ncbi:chemotaxis protein CheW [Hyalangium rubrum]|uniref:Chemotaxis protein CheW n=1 Tax=Hyalangium rubrum TaxID=3103134 RepID=A0ABU5GY90_9BACT|nr:chemotaxis protein CheW [Hyalangium sp. s54d21]MDY7225463.1 chemotaxis protein CheW [Hyalangium sp. s54d21]